MASDGTGWAGPPPQAHAPPLTTEQWAMVQQVEHRVRSLLATHRPPGMLIDIQRNALHACDCHGLGVLVKTLTPNRITITECACVEWKFITKLPGNPMQDRSNQVSPCT